MKDFLAGFLFCCYLCLVTPTHVVVSVVEFIKLFIINPKDEVMEDYEPLEGAREAMFVPVPDSIIDDTDVPDILPPPPPPPSPLSLVSSREEEQVDEEDDGEEQFIQHRLASRGKTNISSRTDNSRGKITFFSRGEAAIKLGPIHININFMLPEKAATNINAAISARIPTSPRPQ